MLKVNYVLVLLLVATWFGMFSCAQSEKPAPPVDTKTGPGGPVPNASEAREAWQVDWENTLTKAKKEGAVTIYQIGSSELRAALGDAFKKKYDIDIEFVSGRGDELVQRILTQSRAGLYLVDFLISGTTTTIVHLKPAGALDPLKPMLILPEAIDTSKWYGNKLWWIDSVESYVLGFAPSVGTYVRINTELVRPGEISSYRDLLNAKWKGKIAMEDPTVAGASHKFIATVGLNIMGLDFLKELAKQEPLITRNWRLVSEWLAKGKASVSIGGQSTVWGEFIKAGAPVEAILPVEGSSLSLGMTISLINRQPHPNASKVFVNWLLTQEGQTLWGKYTVTPSARLDVAKDFVDPLRIPKPGVKYINGDTEDYLLKASEQMNLAREIFGHLLK